MFRRLGFLEKFRKRSADRFLFGEIMAIKIVILIYLAVLLLTAFYLWHNRHSHFLIYNSKNISNFSSLMSWTAIILIIETILGLVIVFQKNKYLNLITLILSSITILIFSLLLNQKDD